MGHSGATVSTDAVIAKLDHNAFVPIAASQTIIVYVVEIYAFLTPSERLPVSQ